MYIGCVYIRKSHSVFATSSSKKEHTPVGGNQSNAGFRTFAIVIGKMLVPLGWYLHNQTLIHLIYWYFLGISRFKGLLGGVKQLAYHPRVPAFSLWHWGGQSWKLESVSSFVFLLGSLGVFLTKKKWGDSNHGGFRWYRWLFFWMMCLLFFSNQKNWLRLNCFLPQELIQLD